MDPQKTEPLSVTAALELAKGVLETISLTIIGEVSELSDKAGYRAVYFTLSDESSALPCVIWRNVYDRQDYQLRQGMLVRVTGRFSLYAAKGRMNFDVRTIQPVGEGELRLRVAALARKLSDEGLMAPSRKLPIPEYPQRIGLVTSPRGKAVHDVLRTLRRRWPLAEILLAGVPVEGESAPQHLLDGLATVAQSAPDVILLVRGGGSYEDLMPFNDERLARAIAASPIPVVTGIGHEPDNSIADMVADFRASTPTAAAERVSPDRDELAAWLANGRRRIDADLQGYIDRLQDRLSRQATHPLFSDPAYLLRQRWLAVEHSQQRLTLAADGLARPFAEQVRYLAAQLDALSPLRILARGYSLASDPAGRLIRQTADVAIGDAISLRLTDGSLDCQVNGIIPIKNETAADDGRI